MKAILQIVIVAAMMIIGGGDLFAQSPNSSTDLTAVSLEDLINLEVTSVSKREEKLFQSAAAVYVITREDIRRSGLTSIPELLRLVPGLSVARIDGNKWSISARGFNSRTANKLLVLIDGRSTYSPIFSGVFWEIQQLPLDEIERIEVIRGPGGTLWGANAVNGVINIITRPASETFGGSVTAGGGSEDQGFTSASYGGPIGTTLFYRVYANYFNRGGLVDTAGFNAHDWQNWANGGWRMEWDRSDRDTFSLQASLFDTALRETTTAVNPVSPLAPPFLSSEEFSGGHVLGRWNRTHSDRSDTKLQVYFDRVHRDLPVLRDHVDTFDIDLQHHVDIGQRQKLVCGLGYRVFFYRVPGADQSFSTKESKQIFSGFVQDEVTLIKNRLRLTLGSKLEHNDFMGYEVQPSVRLSWMPSARQTVWAAASRAVRTPSPLEESIIYDTAVIPGPGGLPIVSRLFGNSVIRSEELRAYEFGYRAQPHHKLSLEISTFYNFYDRLESFDPGPPFPEFNRTPRLVVPFLIGNLLRGKTYGVETLVNLEVRRGWRLRGSYSYLGAQLNHRLAGQDFNVDRFEGSDPRNQFQLHSFLRLPHRLELDNSLYYVSRLPFSQTPGYTRLDARFGWRVREGLELSLGLQNLLDDRHPESRTLEALAVPREVRRRIYGKAAWRF